MEPLKSYAEKDSKGIHLVRWFKEIRNKTDEKYSHARKGKGIFKNNTASTFIYYFCKCLIQWSYKKNVLNIKAKRLRKLLLTLRNFLVLPTAHQKILIFIWDQLWNTGSQTPTARKWMNLRKLINADVQMQKILEFF